MKHIDLTTAIRHDIRLRRRIAAVIHGHAPAQRPSVRARIANIVVFGTVA
jgi:hypothetical protein